MLKINNDKSFLRMDLGNPNNQMLFALMCAQYNQLGIFGCAVITSYIVFNSYKPKSR